MQLSVVLSYGLLTIIVSNYALDSQINKSIDLLKQISANVDNKESDFEMGYVRRT